MGKPIEAASTGKGVSIESVPEILNRQLSAVIQDWHSRVQKEPDLAGIPLTFEERTGHLPQLLHDVSARLRMDEGTKAPIARAVAIHGDLRRKQGKHGSDGRRGVPVIADDYLFDAAPKREAFETEHASS
jgi:hypothetical protein